AIARYDTQAGRIEWHFETGQDATHRVLLSKDSRRIFTANIGSNSISENEQGSGGTWAQPVIAVGRALEGIELARIGREGRAGPEDGGGWAGWGGGAGGGGRAGGAGGAGGGGGARGQVAPDAGTLLAPAVQGQGPPPALCSQIK